jgi:hypothetical protein
VKPKSVKIIMHNEYNHEIYKWQHRKRYIKEDNKKYRNKRNRKRDKQYLKKEYLY